MEGKYDALKTEKKWQEYWKKQKIFAFNSKSKKTVFSLDTPPPTVSGEMHIGHAFGYSQADFVMRYKRMQGFNIFYPFGFDDNGLPTERYVEKKLGVRATSMSRQKFIKLCLKETKEAEKELIKDFMSIGLSPDWSLHYRTIDDWSQKVSQRSFIDLYKKGVEYRKESPTLWCPKCETAVAQIELEDKQAKTFFNDIIFHTLSGRKIIISTTRPELLPACVAVFVHPDDKKNKKLVGEELIVPLFDFRVPVLADQRVDLKKGSGVVMCCTFGDQNDMEWYMAHKLPLKIAINKSGRMTKIAGRYAGLKVKETRERIVQDLKDAGLLAGQEEIVHDVKVHERCGIPFEILNSKQWYIKYTDMKKELLAAGKKLDWHPSHMRNRYDNWVKGAQWDWCISRQRFYGIPFPVWYCKCGEVILAEDSQLPVDPTNDQPKKPCHKCGSKDFTPEKDVMDTWTTSALTPMIALKWVEDPKFFGKMFPMSLRSNGHDIITFWLFRTLLKGLLHEDKIPWGAAMINGWVLDPKGKKMSKSKGNTVNPRKVLDKFGADAFRFFAASAKLGEDTPYREKEVVSGKKTITKLWNLSKFCITHLKDYKPGPKPKLTLVDEWVLSKLQEVIETATQGFERYDFSKDKSAVDNFMWSVFASNYLEMVKYRLYGNLSSKKAAQYTLYKVLLDVLKLFAPIMPHVTEELYQTFFKKHEKEESIHLTNWPKTSKRNKEAEKVGDLSVEIVSAVRKFKNHAQKSLKEPVKIVIQASSNDRALLEKVLEDVRAATHSKIVFGKASQIKLDKVKLDVEFV